MQIQEIEQNGNSFTASGEYEGKPFRLSFDLNENTGEVDGDFSDEERLIILTLCDGELNTEAGTTMKCNHCNVELIPYPIETDLSHCGNTKCNYFFEVNNRTGEVTQDYHTITGRSSRENDYSEGMRDEHY